MSGQENVSAKTLISVLKCKTAELIKFMYSIQTAAACIPALGKLMEGKQNPRMGKEEKGIFIKHLFWQGSLPGHFVQVAHLVSFIFWEVKFLIPYLQVIQLVSGRWH